MEILEQSCEELQNKIETLKLQEHVQKQNWRTRSVPSLTELNPSELPARYKRYDYLGFPVSDDHLWRKPRFTENREVRDLKSVVRNVKEQLGMEQRKRCDMEAEISYLYHENHNLENKIIKLEKDLARIGTLESELQAMEIKSGKLCKSCGDRLETASLLDEPDIALEHDDLDNISNGELIRLKNGGSAFGSRESLNTLGLEIEEDSIIVVPTKEITDIDSLQTPSREKSDSDKGDTSVSILGELEDQYKKLVSKYEALVEAKSKRSQAKDITIETHDICSLTPLSTAKRPSTLSIQKEPIQNEAHYASQCQIYGRRAGLDFRSPMDPTERHFENGPPEYKRLFKEIFDTLRRSVLYEDDNSDHAKVKK